MHEREHHDGGKATQRETDGAATPGKSTLVEQHETAMLAYLAAAKPGRGSARAHSTPALAAEHRLAGGDNPDHAFDVKHAPTHPYRAKLDHLNRDIKDPHGKHVELGRPGVTVGRARRSTTSSRSSTTARSSAT